MIIEVPLVQLFETSETFLWPINLEIKLENIALCLFNWPLLLGSGSFSVADSNPLCLIIDIVYFVQKLLMHS
jgi:hypothetical protein